MDDGSDHAEADHGQRKEMKQRIETAMSGEILRRKSRHINFSSKAIRSGLWTQFYRFVRIVSQPARLTPSSERKEPTKSRTNPAISSAAVSSAKWPASSTCTSAFGTSLR